MKRDTVGRVMDAIGWVFMLGGILAHTVNHLTDGPATDSVGLRMFIGAGCLLLGARTVYDVLRRRDAAEQSRLDTYRAEAMPPTAGPPALGRFDKEAGQ